MKQLHIILPSWRHVFSLAKFHQLWKVSRFIPPRTQPAIGIEQGSAAVNTSAIIVTNNLLLIVVCFFLPGFIKPTHTHTHAHHVLEMFKTFLPSFLPAIGRLLVWYLKREAKTDDGYHASIWTAGWIRSFQTLGRASQPRHGGMLPHNPLPRCHLCKTSFARALAEQLPTLLLHREHAATERSQQD